MDVYSNCDVASKQQMRILFHLGHPAHFHLFKNVIKQLEYLGHESFILIKKKDILQELLDQSDLKYYNILPLGRKDGLLHIALGLIKQDFRLYKFCKKVKIDLLVGTSVSIAHVGMLMRVPAIIVNEDDANVVPLFSLLGYPFSSKIISPDVCDNGKWNGKSIKYNGYHELAYLHPNNFTPNKIIAKDYVNTNIPYFILRFAKLTAHHDNGINGFSVDIIAKVISILKPHGNIYITSEKELDPLYEQYRINIDSINMHHVLSFADLYIGDSQTMAAEAGVLGVPFIRFNDFVGRIGYLNDLELNYKLGFGFKSYDHDQMINKITELLRLKNRKQLFLSRKAKMLSNKIDFAQYLSQLLASYKI